MKKIITAFIFFILLYASQNCFADEYKKTVAELYKSKTFLKQLENTFRVASADTLYYWRLSQYNEILFKNGKPVCDLSDKRNICFKCLSIMEATTLLLQDKKEEFNIMISSKKEYYGLKYEKEKRIVYINTGLFYEWKEAVLKGLNIQEFLDEINLLQTQKILLLFHPAPFSTP